MKPLLLLTLTLALFRTTAISQSPLTIYRVGLQQNTAVVTPLEVYKIFKPNKVELITFSMFFSSCPPCVAEIDSLNKKLRPLTSKGKLGYSVIATIQDSSVVPAMYLRSFAIDKKWNFPIYMDTKTKLADAIRIGNSFPISILLDTNKNTRYSTRPGQSSKEALAEIYKKAEELATVSYTLYDFSVAELNTITDQWAKPSFNIKSVLSSKGFFEMAKNKFSIITQQREIMEVHFYTPEFDRDVGKLTIKLSKEDLFTSYIEKFIQDGYVKDGVRDNKVICKKGKDYVYFAENKKEQLPYTIEVLF